jgi:Flp pilus assembly protein CpaB
VKLTQKRLARPSLGGLLATRKGALTLALVCAVLAAGLLVFAMGRYKSSVATVTPQATVLVSTGEIQKGTSGETIAARKLFKSTPIVSTQVTAGALSDSASLAGTVAHTDILPGQQLTAADFTAVTGVVGQLGPNQRAVSVSIDEAHGDTDVVSAGDRVDVYGAFTDRGVPVLSLLIPDALVLKPAAGAPSTSPGAAATTTTGSSLVLAVSTAQAPLLAYTADNGKIWITLRPANATNPVPGLTTLSSVLTSATSTPTGTHP